MSLPLVTLREFAKDKGIKNVTVMRKAQLVDVLLEWEAQRVAKEEEAKKAEEAKRAEEARKAQEAQEEARRLEETRRAQARAARVQDNFRDDAGMVMDGAQVPPIPANRAVFEQTMRAEEEPADGILEVLTDQGFGFIRCENFLPGDNDVYVAPSQIKRFNLKTGDVIRGPKRIKTQGEKFSALLMIETINGRPVEQAVRRPSFESLTPVFPNERIHLESNSGPISMRIMDLMSPIGKGQRGMIVSPPKAGKTTLLKQVAAAITRNHPDMHLIILLIDERPEEVTDIKESIEDDKVEVIYSTFDELPDRHKRVSEMVIERAKRLVEHKEDVIILLDSMTRLARAYNLTVTSSGRTLSGGLDPAALHMPKRFFGAARNMREGGSLTILATALVDTGSKMDDVVFEEFKGTGNMELVLDRKLSEKRVFPAIDLAKSGTRRDDLLLTRGEYEAMEIIHKALNSAKPEEVAERLLEMFIKTVDNAELVEKVRRNRYI